MEDKAQNTFSDKQSFLSDKQSFLSDKQSFLSDRLFEHHLYYAMELLVLLFGIFLLGLFSFDLALQFVILIFMIFSYITLGLLHHHMNHDLHPKIVIEYILVSLLILSAFLFLNSGRL